MTAGRLDDTGAQRSALREIAAGKVKFVENVKSVLVAYINETKQTLAGQRISRGLRTAPKERASTATSSTS